MSARLPARTDTTPAPKFSADLVRPFIEKTVSEATRAAYHRVIREFFLFVGNVHPTAVTPAQVIAFRDELTKRKRRKAATVATKLAIVRSFFAYLVEVGLLQRNPASTKFVTPPRLPREPQGRALTDREVRHLLVSPARGSTIGARDYAILLVFCRLGLRLTEVCSLRASNLKWSHGRWILKCKIKGGSEETWPVPADVKQAIDDYLKLDKKRRSIVHSDGEDAHLFQPVSNFRTLVYDKPLTQRQVQRIIARYAGLAGIKGRVTPHDFRKTIVTKLLDAGRSYRDVQMVTKHKDPKTIERYDLGRQNLDRNPINDLTYEEQ